jgi:WD40 repeat protein
VTGAVFDRVRHAFVLGGAFSLLFAILLAVVFGVFPRRSGPAMSPPVSKPLAATHHTDTIVALAISPDGEHVASSDYGGFIAQRDLREPEPLEPIQLRPSSYLGLVYDRDGRLLAVPVRSDEIWCQDGDAWHARRVPDLVGGLLASISPDGEQFACYCRDKKTIRVWTWPACETRATLEGHDAVISALAFTPDGRAVATGDCDGIIKFWDPGTGRERASWNAHSQHVLDLGFTRDGTLLASVSLVDKRVRLWNVADGKLRGELMFPRAIGALAFTPDGSHLVLGGSDGVVRFVDVATLREQARFRASTERIYKLRISPDGRLLVTAAGDNRVRVWDLATVRSLGVAATGP